MSVDGETESTEPFQPFTLGRFHVLSPLGSGGMARVFVAEYRGVGGFARRVVIKQIHEQHAANERFVKMFVDEANIAARLTHPNVIQVLDLQAEGKDLFMVLEYVDGLDLNTLFNALASGGKRLPIPVALYVVNQVTGGLIHAHQATAADGSPLGLIHRDITPGNVLLGRHGQVKLSDFGVARAANRMTQTVVGEVKGKYSYMAPEVMQGDPYDQRSDVFGLGVVLWEALTTRPLFRGKSDFHVMEAVLRGTIYPPSAYNPEVPPELDAVALKALDRNVERRYQSGREFKRALASFVMKVDADAALDALVELVNRHAPPSPVESMGEAPPARTPPPSSSPGGKVTSDPALAATLPPRTPEPVAAAKAPAPLVTPPPAPPPAAARPAPAPAPVPPAASAPAPVGSAARLAPIGSSPAPAAAAPAPAAAPVSRPPPPAPPAAAPARAASGARQPPAAPAPAAPATDPPAKPPAPEMDLTWAMPPAQGEPAFFAQVGPGRRLVGPFSTTSVMALLQKRDLSPTDRVGPSPQQLLPAPEAGRLLMLDHLVKPPLPSGPAALTGTVREHRASRLLMGLVQQRASGGLVITSPVGQAIAFITEGGLQYTYVQDPTHHLLALFVQHQPNARALLPQILLQVLRDRMSLPRVMSKQAQLGGGRITAALTALSRERLVHALAWDAARFSFHPGATVPYELAPSRDPLLAVMPVLMGRTLKPQEITAKATRLMDLGLSLTGMDDRMAADLGVTRELQSLRPALDASTPLRQSWPHLVQAGTADEQRLLVTLVLLQECGLLTDGSLAGLSL